MREYTVAVTITTWLLNVPIGLAGEGEVDSMRAWQLGLLFNPGEQQLHLERNGRVVIYDNLKSSDIDRALEEQFERVENMMFVSTLITDHEGNPVRDTETGEFAVEDDGCD